MKPFAKQFKLSEKRYEAMVAAVEIRSPAIRWLPKVASALAFIAWMVVFGKGTDALEGTTFDLLESRSIYSTILAVILGYGIAIACALSSYVVLRNKLVRRSLELHATTPACVWCGYALEGLKIKKQYSTCPECGKDSPVKR